MLQLQGDVTFVPEAGWGITSGLRAGDTPHYPASIPRGATVEHKAVKFTVRTARFDGDANKLIDQIETTSEALSRGRGVHVAGAATTIVTDQGKQGASVRVTGPHTGGVIAAFVFDGSRSRGRGDRAVRCRPGARRGRGFCR